MPANGFLFINKDAASHNLTQSAGVQRTEIQKHVQSGLPRPRKSKAKTLHRARPIVDDKALYNPSIREISCKLDAFDTASTCVDMTTRSLLDYYIYYYHPTVWTYDPRAQSPQPYAFRNSVTKVVQTALLDRLSMYCLLSASASRIRNIDSLPLAGAVEKEHDFMHQALTLMRERISETKLESFEAIEHLVSCMMFLGAAEGYRSNFKAARTHLQATLKILEPWGGVTKLKDKNIQGTLYMSDLFLSSVNLEPCLCACEYDPGPSTRLGLTETEFQWSDDTTLGMRLLAKGDDILPLSLRQVVCEIIESYSVRCGLVVSSMPATRAFETTHWVAKRNMAIRNRLFAFETTDDRTHALRAVLAMWSLLAMNITGRRKTVKVMATRLRSILEDIPDREWDEHEDVLLWILIIGASCSQQGSATSMWFAEQVSKWQTWMELVAGMTSDEDDLVQFLTAFQKKFLFDAHVQGSRTEKLVGFLTGQIDVF